MSHDPEDSTDPLSPLLSAAFAARELRVEARASSVVAQLCLSQGIEPTPLAFGPPTPDGTKETDEPVLPTSNGSRYQILDEIGRGGLGLVMRSRDVDLRREVALKVLRSQLCDRKDLVERFLLEAQVGGQLQHPGIAPVYDLGIAQDGRPFFTMKLVQGSTLATLLDERASESSETVHLLGIFSQICKAVGYAHARGVVHRDLKPANVMVGEFGEVQVVDWGLAKVAGHPDEVPTEQLDGDAQSESLPAPDLSAGPHSQPGTVIGTPGYMAPEQTRGETASAASDVYSLGVILFEILAERTLDKLGAGESHDLERIRELLGGHDSDLQDLVLGCLSSEPADRPHDALEVGRRIDAHMTRSEERVRTAELRAASEEARAEEAGRRFAAEARARRSTQLLAAGILLVVVVGVGGWATWRQNKASRARETTQAVDVQLDAASGHHGQALAAGIYDGEAWARAEGAAGQAVSIASLESGGVDLLDRAESMLNRIREDGASALQAEEDRQELERTQRRVQDLADLGMGRILRPSELYDAYRDAFSDFGIDLDGDEARAMEQLRPHPAKSALVAALDSLWLSLQSSHRENLKTPDEMAAQGWVPADIERSAQWAASCRIAQGVDDAVLPSTIRRAALENDWLVLASSLKDLNVHDLDEREVVLAAAAAQSLNLFDLAFEIREQALLDHPHSFGLHFDHGILCHQRLNRQEKARGHLRTAIALRPEVGTAWNELGNSFTLSDQISDAAACLEHAVALPDGTFIPWENLARSYMRLGEWEDFDRTLERWQAEGVGPRAMYVTRAEAEVVRLRPEDAARSLDLAKAIPTDDRWTLLRTARLFAFVGRNDDALEILEKLVEDIPRFAEAQCNLAHQYSKFKLDFEAALEHMQRGHKLGSALPNWRYSSRAWVSTIETYMAMAERIETGSFDGTDGVMEALYLGIAASSLGEFELSSDLFAEAYQLTIEGGAPGLAPLELRFALDAVFKSTRPWPGEEASELADDRLLEAAQWLEHFVATIRGMVQASNAEPTPKGRIFTIKTQLEDTCTVLSQPTLRRTRDEGFADWVDEEVRAAWAEVWEALEALETEAGR